MVLVIDNGSHLRILESIGVVIRAPTENTDYASDTPNQIWDRMKLRILFPGEVDGAQHQWNDLQKLIFDHRQFSCYLR